MDNGVKKPWLSKTILMNAVMGLLGVLAMFTPTLGGVGAWLSANAAVIAIVWSGLGIALRLITKDKISLID